MAPGLSARPAGWGSSSVNTQGPGLRDLGSALARFVAAAARGSAPTPEPSWGAFFGHVTGALRVHFFAIPAGAVLAGAASASGIAQPWRVVIAAMAAGLGWGGGQLVNDLLDTRADAVDAPDRPAVRGYLPPGPTMLVALGVGVVVSSAIVAVHPAGAGLAAIALLLLLVYGRARRLPLLGNLAHACLVATAAWIGAAAAHPDRSLAECASLGWRQVLLCGAWAALYLEANYEKDSHGDRVAGYFTLVHLIGVRTSAALRIVGSGALGWAAWAASDRDFSRAGILIATALMLGSAVPALIGGSSRALAGYRYAVHGTNLGLLSLGGPALGPAAAIVCWLASAALTERAFFQTPNP